MNYKLFAGALAAASVFGAPAAMAAKSLQLTAVGEGGSMSGTFENEGVLGSDFSDEFSFSLLTDGVMFATISSIFSDARENIDFLSVSIDGQEFATESAGRLEFRVLEGLALKVGSHSLRVRGVNGGNGSYAGTLSFAATNAGAVPEPASWALMILGFGGAGATLRRRTRLTALRLRS